MLNMGMTGRYKWPLKYPSADNQAALQITALLSRGGISKVFQWFLNFGYSLGWVGRDVWKGLCRHMFFKISVHVSGGTSIIVQRSLAPSLIFGQPSEKVLQPCPYFLILIFQCIRQFAATHSTYQWKFIWNV